jgi:predicted SprT family Zn-dependent metalloprotease
MKQLDFLLRLLSPKRGKTTDGDAANPCSIRVSSVAESPRGDDPALATRCAAWLAPLGCTDLATKVRVRWNSRMRSTAGMAYPGKALITLNPRLREFGDEEIERTLRHELAHLLAHHRAGRRRIAPHGTEWRRACTDLGLADEKRCHTLPLPRRSLVRRHTYRCHSCGTEIRRMRPFRRATACLKCCRQHSGGRYDERFRFVKLRG